MCRRVGGIQAYRLIEVRDGPRQIFLVEPPQVVLAQEILLVRGGIDDVGRGQPGALFRGDLHLDLFDHGPRDVRLQLEDVGQLALVLPGPEVRVGRRVDQLDVDPHPVAAALHRSLDDRIDFEGPCDLGQRPYPPLKRITDVRETTRTARMRARLAMSASVMPSAKYSCDGSPDRFSSGSTASAVICGRPVAVARRERRE